MKDEVERVQILAGLLRQLVDQDAVLFELVKDGALAVGLAPFADEIVERGEFGGDLLSRELPIGLNEAAIAAGVGTRGSR